MRTVDLTPHLRRIIARGLGCVDAAEYPDPNVEEAARLVRRDLARIGLADANGDVGSLKGVRTGYVRREDGTPMRVTKDGSGVWRGTRLVGGRREEVMGVPVYLDAQLDIEIG